MGLFDALSAGLNVAAPVAAATEQGKAQATNSNTNFLEKLAQMQQSRAALDMQRQLQTAQIGDIQAQQAQRQAQADAQARRFSPDSINAAAKTWGVDPATAEMMLRDPQTLNYILEKKKPVAPLKATPGEAIQRPDGSWYVPVPAKDTTPKYDQFVDDQGKLHYAPQSVAAENGWNKATGGAGGKGMSGQTMQALQRTAQSYGDLGATVKDMEDFENNADNLKRVNQYSALGNLAMQDVPTDAANGVLGAGGRYITKTMVNAAREKLSKEFPEYMDYLNKAKRTGLAFTEVLPRPNRDLLHIEMGLSGVDAGASDTPDLVKSIQARRQNGLQTFRQILGGQGYLDPQTGAFTIASGGATGGRSQGAGPSNTVGNWPSTSAAPSGAPADPFAPLIPQGKKP